MKNLCFKIILGLTTLLLFTHDSQAACNTTITAVRDTFCLASGDTLTAVASGSGASYVWSGGTITGTSTANPLIVTAVTAGSYTYTVTATDGVGCISTASYTLVTYDLITTVAQVIQPSCGINNGSIQMNVQPSNLNNYVAQFYQGSPLIQSGNSLIMNNLLPGTYSFTIIDFASGCSASVNNIVLTDATSHPTFDSKVVTPETCFGDQNGSVVYSVGNCAGGCTFTWSNDPNNHTDSAFNLKAGTYILSVSGSGCTNITDTVIIPGPSAKLLDTLRVQPDHCHRHDGSGRVVTHGGTPPYSYIWSQGLGLPAYPDSVVNMWGDSSLMLIVMDSHGCVDTLRDSILTTAGPSARITNVDTICATENNGVLMVQATSSDGPFTYRWTGGSTTTVAGGLAPGAYYVTVTDAVGCDTILSARVEAYNAFALLGATPSTIYQGQTTELLVTTNVPVHDVHWLPFVLGSTGSTEVYDRPQATTQYTMILTYGQACYLYDTATVTVLADSSKMVVPNTFTPNNDGINDNFSLVTYQTTVKDFHIWIYDRWGNKVYESTDVNFFWDGSNVFVANKPLNTGVFAYAIEYTLYNNPEKQILGGNISLVK